MPEQDPPGLLERAREGLLSYQPPKGISLSGMGKETALGFLDLLDVFSGKKPMTYKDMLSVPLMGGAMGLARQAIKPTTSSVGVFGGTLGKGFPDKKLGEFLRREQLPDTPDALRQQDKLWADTGITRGPEGMLRYEIPDQAMQFQPRFLRAVANKDVPKEIQMQDLVQHVSLYDNYPGLRKMRVIMDDTKPLGAGGYDFMDNTITLGVKPAANLSPEMQHSTLRSTLAHETQHAIQEIEGFAKGGNPRYMTKLVQRTKLLHPDMQADKIKEAGWRAYHQLAGEGEARAVQARLARPDLINTRVHPRQDYTLPTPEDLPGQRLPLDDFIQYQVGRQLKARPRPPGLLGRDANAAVLRGELL